MTLRTVRTWTRYLVGGSFAVVGCLHFLNPDPFVSIVPSYLPWPLALVYVSGFFEILGGLGLLSARTRSVAAWGLLALLAAVYPANIYMLQNEIYLEGMPQEKWLLWARMPFQFVFALGVLWAGELWPRPPETAVPRDTAEQESQSVT